MQKVKKLTRATKDPGVLWQPGYFHNRYMNFKDNESLDVYLSVHTFIPGWCHASVEPSDFVTSRSEPAFLCWKPSEEAAVRQSAPS